MSRVWNPATGRWNKAVPKPAPETGRCLHPVGHGLICQVKLRKGTCTFHPTRRPKETP